VVVRIDTISVHLLKRSAILKMQSLITSLLLFSSTLFAQDFSLPTPPKGTQVNSIPQLGLGTWYLRGNTSEVIADAIENGYRHIDCAKAYGNQEDIGKGIKEGLKRTGLKREDLWITSKLWNSRHGREEFAIQETLKELDLNYLDLFLVHWPMGNSTGNTTFDYIPTWKAMEKLVRPKNGTRFIGISNFSPAQLENLLKSATIKPKVHQIELHPYLQQPDYLSTNFAHNITVTAYAPLGNTNPVYSQGFYGRTGNLTSKILTHPTIAAVAKDRSCTPAQVVLAWNMHRKVVVIPKAAQAAHQKENIATPEKCKLTDADVSKIAEIKQNVRMNAVPCRDLKFVCFDGLPGAPFCEACT